MAYNSLVTGRTLRLPQVFGSFASNKRNPGGRGGGGGRQNAGNLSAWRAARRP